MKLVLGLSTVRRNVEHRGVKEGGGSYEKQKREICGSRMLTFPQ
jgi:hypothetical protein